MSTKTPKPTISKGCNPKQGDQNWKAKYKFWNQKGIPVACLDDKAEEMLETVLENERIITLNELCIMHHVQPKKVSRFCEISEKFKDIMTYIRAIIGTRREKQTLAKKMDYNCMRHMQGMYDPEWKAQEQYFANLKALQEKNNHASDIHLYMDSYKEMEKSILANNSDSKVQEGGQINQE